MFTFILLLVFCGITDSCTEIAQVCYQCKGYLSICPDGSPFDSTPEKCVSHVMNSATAVASHYYPAGGKCQAYTCTNNLLYISYPTRFAVRQTCNTDCSNFTLIEHVSSTVTASYTSSATRSRGQCFEDCFETVGCYTFSYGGGVCNIYTTCGTSCTMISSWGSTVYTRSCHGGIQVVDCGLLTSPLNGTVNISSGTTYSNQAIYTCSSGYILTGSQKRTCQSNGQWSGSPPVCSADCGSLTSPPNGVVDTSSGTTYNNQATYECVSGYILVGSNIRTCQSNGQWSGSPPVCNADCGALASPPNGVVHTMNGTTYSNQAVYTCTTGYSIIGNSSRICQKNGQWSGSEPSCNIVDCGSLNPPENGYAHNPANTTYLEQATFSCSSGYILTGIAQRICLHNGAWSDTSPICNPVDCNTPTPPNNGSVVAINGTTYGQNATFFCNIGYTMKGFAITRCNASGFWDISPSCNLIECGFLTAPEHGLVQYPTGTMYGETATFQCNTGYYPSHINARTCLSNGFWSMSTPLCIQNGLPIPEPIRLYLAPCICYSNRTFTGLTQQEIINLLIKETKIEKNSTALSRRKLESAKDQRVSSQIVGYAGAAIIAAALCFMLLSDVLTVCRWLDERRNQ